MRKKDSRCLAAVIFLFLFTKHKKREKLWKLKKVEGHLENLSSALKRLLRQEILKSIERMITGSYDILNDAVEVYEKNL